jgi:antibiotic biosynthesis monooxygenase (ABM) superfamily enzyme
MHPNFMSKKLKMAALAWLADYAVITFLLWAFDPWLKQLPLAVRTIPLTLVMVALLQFVVMPFLEKTFDRWLQR